MDSKPFTERILVTEDDQAVREYIEELFSSTGYVLQTAATVSDALDLLSSEQFPVIITDLKLPDGSGMEILDYVQERRYQTTVLIITAYTSTESVINALRHGAYDYIPKPFKPQILLHRVARAMEKARMEEERHLQERKLFALHQITRELSSRIVYATEEERRRISRDLHDGIGQSLAIIKLTLKAVKNKLAQADHEIIQEMNGLATLIEETMDEVSRISKDLNPSYVRELGLFSTLRLYLDVFSQKTGIRSFSYLPEELTFQNPEQEVHLYRIAQEALTNIAKHSKAARVEIRIDLREGLIHFSVSDNGQGFDSESHGGRKGGLGLLGIRERATIMGGRAWIESMPGQGTNVRVEVPYEYTTLSADFPGLD